MDVVIFIGSESDHEVFKDAARRFSTEFGVSHRLEVTSAHRSPERTRALIVEAAEKKGAKRLYRRRRQGRPPGRVRRRADIGAGHRRPRREPRSGRAGRAAFDRPDAEGRARGDHGVGQGRSGSNAALLAVQILSLKNPRLKKKLEDSQEVHGRPGGERLEERSEALMTSFSIQNFGCRVNQAESFSWAEEFERRRDRARSRTRPGPTSWSSTPAP